MSSQANSRQLKKVALIKVNKILKQIQELQRSLHGIVELNNRLTTLSEKKASEILCETNPKMIKLRNSFLSFANKNQHISNEKLIKLREKLALSNKENIQFILDSTKSDSDSDMADIVKAINDIDKSSKTIASIESLLKQRDIIDLPLTNFLQHKDMFNLIHPLIFLKLFSCRDRLIY